MRKLLHSIVLLCFVVICCGCSKQEPPVTLYPPDSDTIEAALDDLGLEWTITEEEDMSEDEEVERILYTLCDTDKKEIAYIYLTGKENHETRSVQISFFSESEIASSLPASDWEKAIRLATILYGRFEDAGQVYKVFEDTYEETAVIDDRPGTKAKGEKRIRWESKVNDVSCFIGFVQTGVDTGRKEIEMVSIQIYNR